jgi:hypothetical protein
VKVNKNGIVILDPSRVRVPISSAELAIITTHKKMDAVLAEQAKAEATQKHRRNHI